MLRGVYNENFKDNYENKGLYFKIETAEDSLIINSDKHYLTIHPEALDNAEKYTESGGITVSLRKEDKYVLIEIKDSGVGLTAEEKPLFLQNSFTVP